MRFEEPNKFHDDLVLAVVAFFAGLAILFSLGCASRSAPEPIWKPEIYLYSPDQARCVLVSDQGDRIDCDEPRMHDVGCIQLQDLKALKVKHQRCEVWK